MTSSATSSPAFSATTPLRARITLTVMVALFFSVCTAVAQPQLVLLNREHVITRYKPGSVIIYKLKTSPEYLTALILDIEEFSIITTFDTVKFNAIERVSLKGLPNKGLNNLFGSFLMGAGAGYFLIDEVNSIIVHKDGFDSDPAVWKPALILTGAGLILKQLRKRSIRIRYPAKLYTAQKGSPFYLNED